MGIIKRELRGRPIPALMPGRRDTYVQRPENIRAPRTTRLAAQRAQGGKFGMYLVNPEANALDQPFAGFGRRHAADRAGEEAQTQPRLQKATRSFRFSSAIH